MTTLNKLLSVAAFALASMAISLQSHSQTASAERHASATLKGDPRRARVASLLN
jgi:hypothetical protein